MAQSISRYACTARFRNPTAERILDARSVGMTPSPARRSKASPSSPGAADRCRRARATRCRRTTARRASGSARRCPAHRRPWQGPLPTGASAPRPGPRTDAATRASRPGSTDPSCPPLPEHALTQGQKVLDVGQHATHQSIVGCAIAADQKPTFAQDRAQERDPGRPQVEQVHGPTRRRGDRPDERFATLGVQRSFGPYADIDITLEGGTTAGGGTERDGERHLGSLTQSLGQPFEGRIQGRVDHAESYTDLRVSHRPGPRARRGACVDRLVCCI